MANTAKNLIGPAFAEMFYNRQDRGDIRSELEASQAYQEANTAFRSVRNELEEQLGIERSEELMEAFLRLTDIESQYYYRLGIQEGLFLQSDQFLTEGI